MSPTRSRNHPPRLRFPVRPRAPTGTEPVPTRSRLLRRARPGRVRRRTWSPVAHISAVRMVSQTARHINDAAKALGYGRPPSDEANLREFASKLEAYAREQTVAQTEMPTRA